MFKITNCILSKELKAVEPLAAVDIQLVEEKLANDALFTQEASKLSEKEGTYTYISLNDAVSKQEMAIIRGFVVSVVTTLTAEKSLVCFFKGKMCKDEDLTELDEYYSITMCCDDMHINGMAEIVELSCEDLEDYIGLFGHYDGMRGVAVDPGEMASILRELTLDNPIPSTERSFLTQRYSVNALVAMLTKGRFFFEETQNSTRLRILSKKISKAELIDTIQGCIDSTSTTAP